jgi:acyl-CoA reductase-like NAD-dependent aldehyde dehydrogenase
MSGEQRMLIDGHLVAAEGGGLFDNINPATEEVLGQAADGTVGDMERAVEAARRAFDTTDWATPTTRAARQLWDSCRLRSRASRRSCGPS